MAYYSNNNTKENNEKFVIWSATADQVDKNIGVSEYIKTEGELVDITSETNNLFLFR